MSEPVALSEVSPVDAGGERPAVPLEYARSADQSGALTMQRAAWIGCRLLAIWWLVGMLEAFGGFLIVMVPSLYNFRYRSPGDLAMASGFILVYTVFEGALVVILWKKAPAIARRIVRGGNPPAETAPETGGATSSATAAPDDNLAQVALSAASAMVGLYIIVNALGEIARVIAGWAAVQSPMASMDFLDSRNVVPLGVEAGKAVVGVFLVVGSAKVAEFVTRLREGHFLSHSDDGAL